MVIKFKVWSITVREYKNLFIINAILSKYGLGVVNFMIKNFTSLTGSAYLWLMNVYFFIQYRLRIIHLSNPSGTIYVLLFLHMELITAR